MSYKKKTKKVRKKIDTAIVNIQATFNNTLVSVTDLDGNVLFRSSAGALGHKGSRKGTPFAATQVGAVLAKEALAAGIKTLEVNIQGPGSGRDSVVRAFQGAGMQLSMLRDVTPLPFNGCRPPKKRRV
jgi:small subunit ribosomal protein S11